LQSVKSYTTMRNTFDSAKKLFPPVSQMIKFNG
jgi:hypothetical protein